MASSLDQVTWISSLVEWLSEVNLGIHRPGCPSPIGNPSMIELIGSNDLARRAMASLRGVACLGEIHMDGDPDVPLPGMEWTLSEPAVQLSCTELRVGQVWCFEHRRDKLYEIIGFSSSDEVLLILWQPGAQGALSPGPSPLRAMSTLMRSTFARVLEAVFR